MKDDPSELVSSSASAGRDTAFWPFHWLPEAPHEARPCTSHRPLRQMNEICQGLAAKCADASLGGTVGPQRGKGLQELRAKREAAALTPSHCLALQPR